MEKEEVEGEVLSADLERVFGTDEAEILAELGEEPAEVADQGGMKVGFGVGVGEAKE